MSEKGFLFRYGISNSNIVECNQVYKFGAGSIHQSPTHLEIPRLSDTTMSNELRQGYLANSIYSLDRVNSEDIYHLVQDNFKNEVQLMIPYNPGSNAEHPIQDELGPKQESIVIRMRQEMLDRAAEERREIQAEAATARNLRHYDYFPVSENTEPQHSRMLPPSRIMTRLQRVISRSGDDGGSRSYSTGLIRKRSDKLKERLL